MNKDDLERLERIERKIENLSDMVQHLHMKQDMAEAKIAKHIEFIEDTYDGLRNPINFAKKYFTKR